MYYTVKKHDGNLRTQDKFRKHEPQPITLIADGVMIKLQLTFVKSAHSFDGSEHLLSSESLRCSQIIGGLLFIV